MLLHIVQICIGSSAVVLNIGHMSSSAICRIQSMQLETSKQLKKSAAEGGQLFWLLFCLLYRRFLDFQTKRCRLASYLMEHIYFEAQLCSEIATSKEGQTQTPAKNRLAGGELDNWKIQNFDKNNEMFKCPYLQFPPIHNSNSRKIKKNLKIPHFYPLWGAY